MAARALRASSGELSAQVILERQDGAGRFLLQGVGLGLSLVPDLELDSKPLLRLVR